MSGCDGAEIESRLKETKLERICSVKSIKSLYVQVLALSFFATDALAQGRSLEAVGSNAVTQVGRIALAFSGLGILCSAIFYAIPADWSQTWAKRSFSGGVIACVLSAGALTFQSFFQGLFR